MPQRGVQIAHQWDQPRDGDARAKGDLILGFGDLLQLGAAVQKGHLGQGAQVFRDPQADIRRPGNQCGVRIGHVPLGQIVDGFGLDHIALGCGRCVRQQEVCQMRRRGQILGRLGRAQNGDVAGAATQVSGQRCGVIRIPVQMRRRHRGHKPGRAKSALAAVMFDHRLLHRVHVPQRRGQPLDGANGFPVQLWQKQNAGI